MKIWIQRPFWRARGWLVEAGELPRITQISRIEEFVLRGWEGGVSKGRMIAVAR